MGHGQSLSSLLSTRLLVCLHMCGSSRSLAGMSVSMCLRLILLRRSPPRQPYLCPEASRKAHLLSRRRCASRALLLFAAAGDSMSHHWLSFALCCPGNGPEHRGFDEIIAFVNGSPLSELPFLARMAARFKFPTVSERWIEGRHSLIKRNLYGCPHASAVHVAYCGIQAVLRRLTQESPNFLTELAEFAKAARTPRRAVAISGILACVPTVAAWP